MAKTAVADIIIPTEFERYAIERTAELSALVQSGIIEQAPEFDVLAAGGGREVHMRSRARRLSYRPPPGLALLVLGLVLAPRLSHVFGRRLSKRWAAACALLALAILIGGCSSGGGGDNNPPPYTGTPKGTHTIAVQAVSGNLTLTTPITLVGN